MTKQKKKFPKMKRAKLEKTKNHIWNSFKQTKINLTKISKID